MSSMAQQAIEMGIDPIMAPMGGTWEDHGLEGPDLGGRGEYNRLKASELYDDYSEKKPTWFATSKEALHYAKNNIGITITRASNGNGYIIKK